MKILCRNEPSVEAVPSSHCTPDADRISGCFNLAMACKCHCSSCTVLHNDNLVLAGSAIQACPCCRFQSICLPHGEKFATTGQVDIHGTCQGPHIFDYAIIRISRYSS